MKDKRLEDQDPLVDRLEHLITLLEKKQEKELEIELPNQLDGLGANYVQMCGTLAGFCGAFILFLLSPRMFPKGSPEVSIIFLLLSAFGYTFVAAWSALAPGLSTDFKLKRLCLCDSIFLLSNVSVWIAFTIILCMNSYIWASIFSLILVILAARAAIKPYQNSILRR